MDRAALATLIHGTAFGPAPRLGPLGRLVALMALRRSRLGLAALDDHLLRDVGLSRAEALREARRPAWGGARGERPWDAPAHWLR